MQSPPSGIRGNPGQDQAADTGLKRGQDVDFYRLLFSATVRFKKNGPLGRVKYWRR